MDEISRQEAKGYLREARLRATVPRVIVLQLLAQSKKPLSHSEVVRELGTDDWDQATVYRNLRTLSEAGLARIANRVGGIARYEASLDGNGDTHTHPHFSCRSCGEVSCLPKAKLTAEVSRQWQKSLEGCELQVIGECPACLAAARTAKREKKKQTS